MATLCLTYPQSSAIADKTQPWMKPTWLDWIREESSLVILPDMLKVWIFFVDRGA